MRGIEEAADEYDGYAAPVLDLLDRASADEDVAAYLTTVETDQMGLPARKTRNEDVAAILRELHALIV